MAYGLHDDPWAPHKKHRVRRVGGRVYVDAYPAFTATFDPVKLISKDDDGAIMSVQGEMACTIPSFDTGKGLRHAWEFHVKFRRAPDSISVIEFNNRDRHGPYAPFIRDIIWEAIKNAL